MSIYRLKGTSGPVLNQAFPLGDGLKIGGGDDCAVKLDAETALAEISIEGPAVVIRSLHESGNLSVNGDRVEQQSLAGGDEIRIGGCRFILQAPGLKPERVLVGDAVRPARRLWPWWVAAALTAAGLLAYQQGWLTPLLQAAGFAP